MGEFGNSSVHSPTHQDLENAIGLLDKRISEMKVIQILQRIRLTPISNASLSEIYCYMQDGFSRGLSIGTDDFSLESLDPLRNWSQKRKCQLRRRLKCNVISERNKRINGAWPSGALRAVRTWRLRKSAEPIGWWVAHVKNGRKLVNLSLTLNVYLWSCKSDIYHVTSCIVCILFTNWTQLIFPHSITQNQPHEWTSANDRVHWN